MADGTDEQDLELDGEADAGTETEGDEPAGETPEADKAKEDKRISDLQSKADKAEARANKAEAALAKTVSRGDGEAPKVQSDPEREALMSELRDASLDAVFAEFAELKDYGVDRSLIEGRTRAEMREAATALVGLVKSVETKARNRVLKEHGIKAEPAGATRQPPKDFASMSNEDFEKELANSKSGGIRPIW